MFKLPYTAVALNILATGAWTASKVGDWFSISATSGTGNATINVNLLYDPGEIPVSNITITNAGLSIVVNVRIFII